MDANTDKDKEQKQVNYPRKGYGIIVLHRLTSEIWNRTLLTFHFLLSLNLVSVLGPSQSPSSELGNA